MLRSQFFWFSPHFCWILPFCVLSEEPREHIHKDIICQVDYCWPNFWSAQVLFLWWIMISLTIMLAAAARNRELKFENWCLNFWRKVSGSAQFVDCTLNLSHFLYQATSEKTCKNFQHSSPSSNLVKKTFFWAVKHIFLIWCTWVCSINLENCVRPHQ